jgi:nucleotide-binding universal stress UspA family protein
MLLTVDVPFDPEGVRVAIEAAAETSSELLVCDVIPLMAGNPAARPGHSFGDPDAQASAQAAAQCAGEHGIRTYEYVFHNPRPERAALEIARQRNVGLLVFAPDAERYGRQRHARAARKIRRGASCPVWPV